MAENPQLRDPCSHPPPRVHSQLINPDSSTLGSLDLCEHDSQGQETAKIPEESCLGMVCRQYAGSIVVPGLARKDQSGEETIQDNGFPR